MSTPEEVYDEEIAPLMTKIIEICRTKGIPMFADFQLTSEDADNSAMFCTTGLFDHVDWSDDKFKQYLKTARPAEPVTFSMIITKGEVK